MKIDFKQKIERRKEREGCRRLKGAIVLEAATILALIVILFSENGIPGGQAVTVTGDGYIKWVDFSVL